MNAQNFKSILEELSIEDSLAPSILRKKLYSKLHELHPDRTGGEFHNKQQEELFHKIYQALRYLENINEPQSGLVPIDQTAKLAVEISRAQSEPTIKNQASSSIEIYRNINRRRYALPKITSGILLSICTLMISLSGQLEKTPFTKHLAQGYQRKNWRI
jgi:hypothetical protein